MTQINWPQKLRNVVFCTGTVLFFKKAKYFPRTFSDHRRPHEIWYLYAAFTEKNDASDFRFQAGLLGSYARCIKLTRPVRNKLANLHYRWKWGIWVPPLNFSRLDPINCHWKGKQGGFQIYHPNYPTCGYHRYRHDYPEPKEEEEK